MFNAIHYPSPGQENVFKNTEIANPNAGRNSPNYETSNWAMDYIVARSPTSPPPLSPTLQNNGGFMTTARTTSRLVGKRKRIYGEEYRELTLLDAEPQAKILKLEQSDYDIVVENFTKKYAPTALTQAFVTRPTLQTTATDDLDSSSCPETVATFNNNNQTDDNTGNTNLKGNSDFVPTYTARKYQIKDLNTNQSLLCTHCYSLECICYIIDKIDCL